ncbi:hypothetical protein ACFFX0_22920 [Citricoccus parietis]|uniref:Uncharacterized protein n=1 Tax=Citricoccus parietis TaxID=592307 RepID=A0ABV5G5H4_9MICC
MRHRFRQRREEIARVQRWPDFVLPVVKQCLSAPRDRFGLQGAIGEIVQDTQCFIGGPSLAQSVAALAVPVECLGILRRGRLVLIVQFQHLNKGLREPELNPRPPRDEQVVNGHV